jgi:hypothetical protein
LADVDRYARNLRAAGESPAVVDTLPQFGQLDALLRNRLEDHAQNLVQLIR